MARPKTPTTPPVAPTLKPGSLAETSRNLNELAKLDSEAELRTLELARKLGYDGPLDPDVIERGVVNQMRRTVEACLETGRMLLILKERVGHGSFMQRLQKLGVEHKAAAKFMQASLKFSNVASTRHLTEAIGSQTKLLELLVLDQDEIEELATEGSVLDIELDDIAGMTVRELREALADARQTVQAKEKVIAKRDAKLAKLEEQAELPQEAAMLADIQERIRSLVAATLQLGNLVVELDGREISEELRTMVNADCEYAAQTFADILMRAGIPVQFQEMVDPSWMKKAGKASGKTGNKG